MAGKSSNSGNWSPGSPGTRYKVSGKNREFYTFENAPGIGAYATGGTLIDGGDGYIYHIFTGDGTFVVNRPPAIIDSVEYTIVAGGGAGGNPFGGGGGGGGFLFGQATVSNTPGSYPITVGGGGSYPQPTAALRNGSPSTAFGLTAAGGGGGGSSASGAPGGSGGGSQGSTGTTFPATSGNTPATIPRQGYGGGSGPFPNATIGSGGGGGAGGIGNPGTPASGAGNGGPGRIAPEFPSTIVQPAIPSPVLPAWQPLVGPSGYAAGGQGFPAPTQRTSPANSGYGSVGGAPNVGNGGSGIVCIRYAKSAPYQRATGGTVEPSTDPNHPGVWRHIFTTPGTFTVTDPSLQWIDYLAVGGGGGGGGTPPASSPPIAGNVGGGGGAGGFVTSIHAVESGAPFSPSDSHAWNPGYSVITGEQMPVGAQAYPVSIGPGGAGGSAAGGTGTTGTNTTIGAPGPTQIIAYGGGGGATAAPAPTITTGGAGGSAGGSAKGSTPGTSTRGVATPNYPTPLGNYGTQGNPGGDVVFPAAASGGAGGGAGGYGGSMPTPGGDGWYSVISPPAYGTSGPVAGRRYFAGGGGGYPGGAAPASGGGGSGAPLTPRPATANTGGGGGAGGQGLPLVAGTGGSGIVIIQYPE
jgi:hypothetical protein